MSRVMKGSASYLYCSFYLELSCLRTLDSSRAWKKTSRNSDKIFNCYTLIIGFLSVPLASALNCYQCNTTWDMGCWDPYKLPPPGVDPKNLKSCLASPNASNENATYYCVKEYYSTPTLHYGHQPYVSRTCGVDPIKSQDNAIVFGEHEEGCRTWTAATKIENKMYEIEKSICKCSSDKCNSGMGNLFLNKELVTMLLILFTSLTYLTIF